MVESNKVNLTDLEITLPEKLSNSLQKKTEKETYQNLTQMDKKYNFGEIHYTALIDI